MCTNSIDSNPLPKESKQAYIKRRTIELYDSLPEEEVERKKHLEVRDEVIELNYTFFGYIASHTFINNSAVSYEDKFQSALTHFCECWWWYRWKGHYRTDLSFGVFFKPRIGEMIERELNQVKYSVRRSLCMKVGAQLGKHWGQVRYEDLAKVNLPVDEMNSLKAIFGSLYIADLEEHELYIPAPQAEHEEFDIGLEYDDIQTLLEHELVEEERPLTDRDLKRMSTMYDIDYNKLKDAYPQALKHLYSQLRNKLDNQIFDDNM